METVFAIWIFLFFIIALFLLTTANRAAANQSKIAGVIVKLLLSFLIHIPVSAVTGFLLLFITVGADKFERERKIGAGEITAGLIIIFGYALTGWLLYSFINGKLVKLLSIFNLYSEKPQSIFKAE